MLARMIEGAGPRSAAGYRRRREENLTHAEQLRTLLLHLQPAPTAMNRAAEQAETGKLNS
jgi:hypothetical protein